MKILENIKNVVITVIVALIVYCVCVPSPAHASCKDAVRIDTYSYNNNFVEVFNDGSRIVTYNDENVIEKYDCNNNVVYSYNINDIKDSIKVIDEYYKNDNTKIVLLNNDSFAYIDTKADKYEFTAYELGDWSINFKNEKELREYITSYIQFHKTRVEADKKIGEFKPVSTLNIDGNITTIYNDGSKLEGVNGKYTFIPCLAYNNKGIKLDNENDCKNCIDTYKAIKENGSY